jgi:hypothetical protein
MPLLEIDTTVTISCPPSKGDEWKSFQFNFEGFDYLCSDDPDESSVKPGEYILSPKFICKGHTWNLIICPKHSFDRGSTDVSIFLKNNTICGTETLAIKYEIMILDKFGCVKKKRWLNKMFNRPDHSIGWPGFISRSFIQDASNNIFDSKGTLSVIVSIKDEPTAPFVPKNPFLDTMKRNCNVEENADVLFEVSEAEANEENTRRSRVSVPFHAHSQILQMCAPMLAALVGPREGEGNAIVSISDIRPVVFKYMLLSVYGGSVPEEDLNTYAKEIIDAADRYSISHLKMEAEAAYVESTTITSENAMENLLYADAKNCALLKEAVMDYFAANGQEAIRGVSFDNFPSHLVTDLLVSTTRRTETRVDDDNYTTMRVSQLRRKLDEKGLDGADGSREAMIAALQNSTAAQPSEN